MPILKGQRALVTGGARGLGRAMLDAFAREGARVLVQDFDQAVAEAAAKEIRAASGGEAIAMGGDIANPADVAAVFKRMDEAWGGIDILVNNAGVSANRDVLEITLEEWDRAMAVNLRAPFICAQEAGRRMTKQKSGNVINISSIWGLMAAPHRVAYCVSKAGIAQLTRVLASEWAPHGVRVNAIAPGYTETRMLRDVFNAGRADEKAILRRTPMGRLAEPREIADMALYLASPQSSFVTGQVMAVDGGWTAYGLY
ncbi:MAG: 3-oxoacyl-ACP reductase family protein [Alphaproteobacteria bacterium]